MGTHIIRTGLLGFALSLLLFTSEARAKNFAFCRNGKPIDQNSSDHKTLAAPPSKQALAIYAGVPDAQECSYKTKENTFDWEHPHDCQKICADNQSAVGELMSCLSEAVDKSFAVVEASFFELDNSLSAAGISFDQASTGKISGASGDIGPYLLLPAEKRSPMRIFFGNKQQASIDISKPSWNGEFSKTIDAMVGHCRSKPASPSLDCNKLKTLNLAFAAKLKLLETSVALRNELKKATGIEPEQAVLCDSGYSGNGAAADKKSMTQAPRPANFPHGLGKLPELLKDCHNPKVPTVGVSCESLRGTGLEPLIGELQLLMGAPGMPKNYIDALRLKLAQTLIQQAREATGRPLSALPKECDRFKEGLSAVNAPLSEAEQSKSRERLAQIKTKAVELTEMIRKLKTLERVPLQKNCRVVANEYQCDQNSDFERAQAEIFVLRKKVSDLNQHYPLLTARSESPKNIYDYPMAEAMAKAQPAQLTGLVEEARRKVAVAQRDHLVRACNDINDRSGWREEPNSLSWMDLIEMPGLVDTVTKIPGFDAFNDVHSCLKFKAEKIRSSLSNMHTAAAGFSTIGCAAGTILTGPLMGGVCSVAMMAVTSASNYTNIVMVAERRQDWISECRERTGSTEEKALCSDEDYLKARADYEDAVASLKMDLGMEGLGYVSSVLALASKKLPKISLSKFASKIRTAGKDANKLADIERSIASELNPSSAVSRAESGAAKVADAPTSAAPEIAAKPDSMHPSSPGNVPPSNPQGPSALRIVSEPPRPAPGARPPVRAIPDATDGVPVDITVVDSSKTPSGPPELRKVSQPPRPSPGARPKSPRPGNNPSDGTAVEITIDTSKSFDPDATQVTGPAPKTHANASYVSGGPKPKAVSDIDIIDGKTWQTTGAKVELNFPGGTSEIEVVPTRYHELRDVSRMTAAEERAAKVLKEKGISDGKPLQHIADGGTRKVFDHPKDPSLVVKVYDPNLPVIKAKKNPRPDLDPQAFRIPEKRIARMIQRERTLEPWLNKTFKKYHLRCRPNSYELADQGIIIQKRWPPNAKSVAEYQQMLHKDGRFREWDAFTARVEAVKNDLRIKRQKMSEFNADQFDLNLQRDSINAPPEDVPIDFGRIEHPELPNGPDPLHPGKVHEDPLSGCKVVEEPGPDGKIIPWLDCADW